MQKLVSLFLLSVLLATGNLLAQWSVPNNAMADASTSRSCSWRGYITGYMAMIQHKAPSGTTWATFGSVGGPGIANITGSFPFGTPGVWSVRVVEMPSGSTLASTTFTILPATTPTTFSLSATTFTYNGSAQGPTIVASPSGATFTAGGTLSAITPGSYTATAVASGSYAGSNTTLTWTINKANQSITFANPGAQTYGGKLTLSGSSSSGLPVTYAVASGPAVASGNTLTFTGIGSVTVVASQAGNSNYNAAASVSQTFVVAACPTVFSLSPASFTYNGNTQRPTVMASPSGATFTTGGVLSAVNAGAYTATAAASGCYSGRNTALSWTISKANQSITFTNPGAQTYGTSLALGATASSGLSVTYAVASGPAMVSGNTLTFNGIGSVTVVASQAGNSNYNAAASVSQTFAVAACPVSFGLNQQAFTYNGSEQGPTVTASPPGATFTTTGQLRATSGGSYTVTAVATGGYTGKSVLTWFIAPLSQTITFPEIGQQTYGTPLTLNATTSSG